MNILKYGGQTPDAISLPLVPSKIFGWRTYIPGIKVPSCRFKGYSSPKRGDVAIFHATSMPKDHLKGVPQSMRPSIIKRIVAIPGDKFEIKDMKIFVNDHKERTSVVRQYILKVVLDTQLPQKTLEGFQAYSIEASGRDEYAYSLTMTRRQMDHYESIKLSNNIKEIKRETSQEKNKMVDNMDSIILPKRNMTINLDNQTHELYIMTIKNVEDSFVLRDNRGKKEFYLHGKRIAKYRFREGYYMMIGDNYHDSLDSRHTGMIPRSHIFAKHLFTLCHLYWSNSYYLILLVVFFALFALLFLFN